MQVLHCVAMDTAEYRKYLVDDEHVDQLHAARERYDLRFIAVLSLHRLDDVPHARLLWALSVGHLMIFVIYV